MNKSLSGWVEGPYSLETPNIELSIAGGWYCYTHTKVGVWACLWRAVRVGQAAGIQFREMTGTQGSSLLRAICMT